MPNDWAEFAADRIATNGTTLKVRHAGEGQAVVLMHGWCGSSHAWRKVAPALAAEYSVIVPDMRGYGDSDKPEDGYDAESGARDIAGVLDHYGHRQAHVVGHDMGAPVALAFSGLFPERTRSVTWIDEPLLGFDTERYTAYTPWNHGGYWQFGFNTHPGLAELMYAGKEEAFLKLIFAAMTQVKDAVTEADIAEHARGMKLPGGIAGWVGWYRAAHATGDAICRMAKEGQFMASTLAIAGDMGVKAIVDEIKRAVPQATGVVYDVCGHLIPEEMPDRLVAGLQAHFARSEKPA